MNTSIMKMIRSVTERSIGLTIVIILAGIMPAHSAELSEQALRGKRIYVGGESESGTPINALVARGGTSISASILPCVGCHGDYGKGRPEGGVVPPDITWNNRVPGIVGQP